MTLVSFNEVQFWPLLDLWQLDRHKNVGGMNKVSDAMEKMERQSAETRKQLEQVMKAEIKTRWALHFQNTCNSRTLSRHIHIIAWNDVSYKTRMAYTTTDCNVNVVYRNNVYKKNCIGKRVKQSFRMRVVSYEALFPKCEHHFDMRFVPGGGGALTYIGSIGMCGP